MESSSDQLVWALLGLAAFASIVGLASQNLSCRTEGWDVPKCIASGIGEKLKENVAKICRRSSRLKNDLHKELLQQPLDHNLHWRDTKIPPSMYSGDIAKMDNPERGQVGGPALRWALFACALQVCIWVAVPPFCWKVLACPKDQMCKLSSWWLAVMMTMIIPLLLLEFLVFKVLIVPFSLCFANHANYPKLFGLETSFFQYVGFQFLMSAMAHTDVVTSGIFAAKAVGSYWHDQEIQLMMTQYFDQVFNVRIFESIGCLWLLTVGWWALSFQIVYGICSSYPFNPRTRRGNATRYNWQPEMSMEDPLIYDTFLKQPTGHAGVVTIVARVCRMVSVTAPSNHYDKVMSTSSLARRFQYPSVLSQKAFTSIWQLWAFLIWEGGGNLAIQCLWASLLKTLDPSGGIDPVVIVSLTLGLANGFVQGCNDINDAYRIWRETQKTDSKAAFLDLMYESGLGCISNALWEFIRKDLEKSWAVAYEELKEEPTVIAFGTSTDGAETLNKMIVKNKFMFHHRTAKNGLKAKRLNELYFGLHLASDLVYFCIIFGSFYQFTVMIFAHAPLHMHGRS